MRYLILISFVVFILSFGKAQPVTNNTETTFYIENLVVQHARSAIDFIGKLADTSEKQGNRLKNIINFSKSHVERCNLLRGGLTSVYSDCIGKEMLNAFILIEILEKENRLWS